MEEIKKYKKAYRIFLILGILGVLDIASKSVIESSYGIQDIGAISISLMFLVSLVLGSSIGSIVGSFASLIMGLSLIWLVVAWINRRKIKFLEKELKNEVSDQ